MSNFWEAHKHKIFGALIGIGATLLLIGSNVLCSKLPPVFAQVCVATASAVSDAAKLEAERQKTVQPSTGKAAVDLSKPLCDEAHCLSSGYALPLDDGGICRCAVNP